VHPTSRRTTTGARPSRRGSVEAWAADGTLEAVEDPSLRFAVGVQWHPEAGEDASLFEELVEQAREYRSARAQ
jgi:gamma-glutamyl-gamma-aminobutyrate hydrolase PuuD